MDNGKYIPSMDAVIRQMDALAGVIECSECRENYHQIAEWLRELRVYKKFEECGYEMPKPKRLLRLETRYKGFGYACPYCDRGVTHEIVRHRIASYSQESTRYCNYSADKFGNELTFIRPFYWNDEPEKMEAWLCHMKLTEETYMQLIKLGASPQEARAILPNSLKTEIVVTMNIREWRHFFKVRCSPAAHPQMREVAIPILKRFQEIIPVVFDDIKVEEKL